ncbi:tripartite motif protein, putative [Babesia caballi]|uniref:Tripartite motif protein, putative n=1 Tax=Babesia caballi TaxID=5871 RepID=A0AAV4LTT0_BABCB|nr:tripartite motif protein, putative [Babesia caballi]
MYELLDSAISLKPGAPAEAAGRGADGPTLGRLGVDHLEWSQPGTSFASVENVRCPHHFALPIQYFCLDCKNGEGCFCSECALTRHATCDVRTLDEAYTMVLNNVIRKWASQFTSRADGLDVTFAQQLADKREEWTMKLQEVQGALLKSCDDISTTLRELEHSLLRWLTQSHQSFTQEHEKVCAHVERTLESYAANAEMLRQQRRLPPARLLLFYNENHARLRQMLLGTTPRDSERVIGQAARHLGTRLDNINATCVEYSKLLTQLERSIRQSGSQ